MLKMKQEYTPGQMIRFEAMCLCHNAARLWEAMLASRPELDFLEVPAIAGMRSIKRNPEGGFNSINRNRQHYEDLTRALEQARRRIEEGPVSGNSRQAWLLLNRCRYHCMTILSMMEKNEAPNLRPRHP